VHLQQHEAPEAPWLAAVSTKLPVSVHDVYEARKTLDSSVGDGKSILVHVILLGSTFVYLTEGRGRGVQWMDIKISHEEHLLSKCPEICAYVGV